MEAAAIDGARNRDPDAAIRLWRWVAADLRGNAAVSPGVRSLLADALDAAIRNPAKAGQALGLIGKRARPKDSKVSARHAKIVQFILQLQRMGFGPHEKHDGDTTLAHIAQHFGTSLRTVERAWGKYTATRAALADTKVRRA